MKKNIFLSKNGHVLEPFGCDVIYWYLPEISRPRSHRCGRRYHNQPGSSLLKLVYNKRRKYGNFHIKLRKFLVKLVLDKASMAACSLMHCTVDDWLTDMHQAIKQPVDIRLTVTVDRTLSNKNRLLKLKWSRYAINAHRWR